MKNQLLWAFSLLVLLMIACKPAATTEEAATAAKTDSTAAMAPKAPAEFADAKYSEIVKNGQAALSKGDVAAWLSSFADNAVYVWNNGDSLAGKAAITAYWTKRRADVVDSLTFKNQIYLPIQVNTPQSVEAPGVWVLAWYQTFAKYKTTGKKMNQWMHADTHFDANGKIDRVILYSDRSLINAAMTK
ncbi:MAG: nuclear transport factor 2 family protein [Saprospiraceae bacterium]